MKKIINTFLMITLFSLFFYACGETGPTISNDPGTNTNKAPNAPTNPFPADSSTNVNRLVNLSWLCTDPDAADTLNYEVRISESNPPTVLFASGLTSPFCSIGLVDSNKTFFWRVTAKDNHGAVTSGPVWRFKTR